MIDINTKIHDSLSIEFKVGFKPKENNLSRNFTVGMWLFIPNSLDITPSTYSKSDFYRDVKSNIRLVIPPYRLDDIVGGKAEPMHNVLNAVGEEYEYQLRVFSAIVKSALRDTDSIDDARFISSLDDIFRVFRSFRECRTHSLCGEFLCNICSQAALGRMDKGGDREGLSNLVLRIDSYRKEHGYITVIPGDSENNRNFLHRQSVLKKFVESPFYLRAPKKKDGAIAEQAYYSVAAGLAMLFATVIAWAFQLRFGNLTWPLFIALIISYMLKDRIKELMRFYFAHRVGARYFDNKAHIIFKDRKIGTLKEGMDFIPTSKVPDEVMNIRNRQRNFDEASRVPDEKIILYRKRVTVDRDINDIVRFQVSNLLHKMDNPLKGVKALDSKGNPIEIDCIKDYHLNVVLQYEQGSERDFKHFRIFLTRDGIQSIREID